MLKWTTLKTLHELRGFLGLTGYYRKFVASYSKIDWPLTEQLKKNNFGWNETTKEAFQRLKIAMTTVLVLALPDFTASFIVETNASRHGLGAVLMQRDNGHSLFTTTYCHPKQGISQFMNVSSWR